MKRDPLAIARRTLTMYQPMLRSSVDASERAALVDFQRLVFGRHAYQHRQNFHTWLYESGFAEICFAKDGEEVVGQQGAIGCNVQVGDEILKGCFAIDLHVRDDWKMKGLGVALTASLLESYDLVMGVGISEDAIAMYRRLGWHDLGQVSYWMLITSLAGVPINANESLFRKIKKYLWTAFALSRLKLTGYTRDKATLEKCTQFEQWHAEVLNANAASCHELWTVEKLNWRYQSSQYVCFSVREANELAGFVVLRLEQAGHLQIWHICEFAAMQSENVSSMVGALSRQALLHGIARIVFCGRDMGLESNLKKHTFVHRDHGGRWMIHCRKSELHDVVSSSNCWALSGAASDSDFHAIFTGADPE